MRSVEERRASLLEWAETLKSGEYKQIVGVLAHRKHESEYDPKAGCCIDIACIVENPELEDDFRVFEKGKDYDSPANEIYKWFNEFYGFGYNKQRTLTSMFISMNDYLGFNFFQIARFVRSRIEQLLDEDEFEKLFDEISDIAVKLGRFKR